MIYIPKSGMPAKDVKILEEVREYESKYFTFDTPIPFCGLTLFPVSVRNYNLFLMVSDCFTLNKNDDPKGIKKTHLEYLIDKMQDKQEGLIWSFRFSTLVELIFHIKVGFQCDKCKDFKTWVELNAKVKAMAENGENVNPLQCECGGHYLPTLEFATDEKTNKKFLKIDGRVITAADFNRLRRIALYQNLPDYKDDSWVHPSIRKDQEKKREIQARANGGEASASLERKIVCVSSKTPYKIDELYDLSMRKFLILLDAVDSAITYQAELQGRMSGLVTSKKPIDHWVYKREKGLYDVAQDADAYKGTIGRANSGG